MGLHDWDIVVRYGLQDVEAFLSRHTTASPQFVHKQAAVFACHLVARVAFYKNVRVERVAGCHILAVGVVAIERCDAGRCGEKIPQTQLQGAALIHIHPHRFCLL